MYFERSTGNGLAYNYQPASSASAVTFVCFNPLTGDKSMWDDVVKSSLVDGGHGFLTWNLRGQQDSPFTPDTITEQSIVEDAAALLSTIQPQNPVYVGLSVGGLYAAKTHLSAQGHPCVAMVLINTLRIIGPRLSWINHALVRLAETGGLELLRDVYSPLLLGEGWIEKNRSGFLKQDNYHPILPKDGALHLLKAGAATRWDVNWQDIKVPVLNITGMQDHIFRNDEDIAELLKLFPSVKALNYKDAGHMIPVEASAALANDITEFVNTIQ